ncbi:hypothetical protein RUM44_009416 [Polyplax serrata]|uniref:Ubiquitin carboxyl-terminal hydrolase 47 n=1 Tax=Polyplax serrata TaxID=468196 RepID=A0ABR1ASL8_POLSC
MVCALEENLVFCVIQDANDSGSVREKFNFPASSTVADFYQEVGRRIHCHQDSFNLILQGNQNENVVHLSRCNPTETIETVGFKIGPNTKNTIVVMSSSGVELSKAYDLRTKTMSCPSASGDYETPAVPLPPPPPVSTSNSGGDCSCSNTIVRQENVFVGLVNQAMTCYLNSLLQALYMTPEFRNAMYNWEFDGSPSEESKSIPYQLQKLFLNLQTSKKFAVETTELTRSFGWDSWEAWQQHDIQELCRVMFDTLEQKFKNTKQADLINRLYEGKMIDYVKCLECSTEKSREDTFLDIPLPVRPFGSNVAYGSVEEALRAFVQPETLEGNNQYHCDTCNKKCDAHKGLKFSKFPYLLTLHLKRFDFDFNTLHRIKLNDKVSFPEKLNLNSFIAQEKGCEMGSEASPEDNTIKCDDSCTTDSGSALDDEVCQGIDTVNVTNSHDNHNSDYQDDDEGIDVGQQHDNEKSRQSAWETGPYVYELFSIMIHSGSAAGGHYYAYIKDFKDGEWYCFNDQNVARITYDDIRKTYGGGPIKGYYSGAYSSSTNAYMLMYRQIDKERNASALTVDEFPEHIKILHNKLEEQKEYDSVSKNMDFDTCKLRIYCYCSNQNAISEAKLYVYNECTLKETVQVAYRRLNLEKIVPLERCRLVSYDELRKTIECSFEGKDEDTIGEICLNHGTDFLMDIREEGEEFEVYKWGDINTAVTVVNTENDEVRSPTVVRANCSQTVKEYKELVAKQLKLPGDMMFVALDKFNQRKILQKDDVTLRNEDFYDNIKIYVAGCLNTEEVEFQRYVVLQKLQKIIDKFEHVITLYVTLPDVDNETLERLNIPPLEQSKIINISKAITDELMVTCRSRGTSPCQRDLSPQPLPDPEDECVGPTGPHSDQSASEDSSLTDSERTIVGDAPGDCLAQLSPNGSPTGSDHNVSSFEAEANECLGKRSDRYGGKFSSGMHRSDEMQNWDTDDIPSRTFNYFFKAVSHSENNLNQKVLKVVVDKRMYQGTFKQCLEPFVGVSVEHFKINRSCSKHSDLEYSTLPESLDIYKDNEKLTVKLGKALKKGEYLGYIFLLAPNSDEPDKYLFEWVIANGSPVTQVKKEILEELKRKCAIEIPFNRCRLRRKNWRIPAKPYLDGTTFDDLNSHWEMFVQELPGEEPVTSPKQKLMIVRHLGSTTREAKPFEEIVLDSNSVVEFRDKLSELSGIPVEFLETAKSPGFACLDLSVLTPYIDVEWTPASKLSDDSSSNIYDDGHVVFYRDGRDKSKCFLTKDRKLLEDRRNRFYSPIKERALKIYLDTPSRKDESDID